MFKSYKKTLIIVLISAVNLLIPVNALLKCISTKVQKFKVREVIQRN